MAKGITETDVHQAADALVATGERPTVERIRAHLGTGSPNTVTRWLETWWQGLGDRLASGRGGLALPDAPLTITTLATELWEQALIAARTEADATLAEDRAALAAERAGMEQELAHGRREVHTYQEAAAIAEQGRAAADARLADAERLIEQQATQLTDLAAQRQALTGRIEAIEKERAVLAERLQQQESAARAEREAQLQHVRSLENRSHAEVDRARQETKALEQRIEALQKEHAARARAMVERNEESLAALAVSLCTAASHQGRAEALEKQLAQQADWRAAFEERYARPRESTRQGRVGESRKPGPRKRSGKAKTL